MSDDMCFPSKCVLRTYYSLLRLRGVSSRGSRAGEGDKADFDNLREIINLFGRLRRLVKYFLFLPDSTGRRAYELKQKTAAKLKSLN